MSDPRPPSPSAPQHDSDRPPSSSLPPPASLEHALSARIDAFSPLCPSARTSYTRVDFSGGTGANTPRPDFAGEVDEEMDDSDAQPVAEDAIPQTAQVSLTFLLVSGRRRTMGFDPETTVGRVKELVWNAWPNGEHVPHLCAPGAVSRPPRTDDGAAARCGGAPSALSGTSPRPGC